ncbi:MAG: DUF308 domain-containing protein [Paludibacteraceae bacterium]|nr:DUF308 domain-containing protein [Paludibacteraceae bacterium]
MNTSTKIWMCLGGIALVALGVLCIAHPGDTILSLAWALGLTLLVSGCSTFGVWVTLRAINPFNSLTFLTALLQVFLGVLLIINPAPLAIALPFVFAFWVLFEGVELAIDSFNYKRLGFRTWWLLCLLGLLAAVAGCYGLFCDPVASAKVLAWIVGVAIILDGVGYWVKVAAINRVQQKMNRVANRIREAVDIEDVEEVK